MRARDWFESIRVGVVEMAKLEQEIEATETQAGPHGQSAGSIGGGGSHDGLRGIDRMVDAGVRERLARLHARYDPEVDSALEVLYGKSGNGGLSKAKQSVDADILCCHYLQGMEWADIAAGLAGRQVARPNGWVRMRAMRALAYIDRVGMASLADS